MELARILSYISTLVLIISGLLVLYATYKINEIRLRQASIEEDIVNKKLRSLEHEFDHKRALYDQTANITAQISTSISQQLINNPAWLDRFMDETGVTYRASVFGIRILHFFHEKQKIAQEAINRVEELLKITKDTQYYLLIDSGTTMYPVFVEITRRLEQKEKKLLWQRVCLVTNNIPGVQYIMKNAKEDLADDYSEIAIDCLLVPGKPLSVYAAITGDETTKWLAELKELLDSRRGDGEKIRVIGFVTGNYVTREIIDNTVHYYPVARGEGHVEIKQRIVDNSDEVFLLSPLMKFSFAGVNLLNEVNAFDIDRNEVKARQHPKRVKYEKIVIPEKTGCTFIATRRVHGAMFEQFGNLLRYELRQLYGNDSVIMPEFDLKYWHPNIEDNRQLEIEREIPHNNLRKEFEKGVNIWDRDWVSEKELKAAVKGV